MKNKKGEFNFRDLFTKWYFVLIAIFLLIVLFFVCTSELHVQNYFLKGNFDIGSKTFIKLNVPNGEESSDTVLITNNGRDDEFAVSFLGLENIASASENNFYIESGNSKKVTFNFMGFSPDLGINLGWLIIKSSSSEKKIPVIIGIEDKKTFFAITQTPIPNYLNIFPNGKIGVDIKFSNLKDFNLHNVKAVYSIKDFDNHIYFSETEDFSIRDSLSVAKIFDLPESVGKGNYIFIVTSESDDSKSFSSYVFEVKGKGFALNLDILQNYLIIFILIIVGGVLIYFIYFIRSGSGLYQLNKQQRKEMKKNLALIKKYKEEMKKDLNADLINEERRIFEERAKLRKEKEAQELNVLREKIKKEKRKSSIFWKSLRYIGGGIKSYFERHKREELREREEAEREERNKRAKELREQREKEREEELERRKPSVFKKLFRKLKENYKSYKEKQRRRELNRIREEEQEERNKRAKELREQREKEREEELERRKPSVFKKLFRKLRKGIRAYKEKQRREKLRKIREEEQEERNRRFRELREQKEKEQEERNKRARELREQREREKENLRKISAIKRFFRKIGNGLSNFLKITGRKAKKITRETAKEQEILSEKISKEGVEEVSLLKKIFGIFRRRTRKLVEESAKEQEKLEEKKEKLTKEGQKEATSQFKEKKTKLLEIFQEKLKQVDEKKEEIVKELKEKHEEQREEIKELEKQNKRNEIERRLILWEKEAEKMPVAKKQLNIKEDKIKKILKIEEKQTEQEFMKKFYSDLRRKRFKLE